MTRVTHASRTPSGVAISSLYRVGCLTRSVLICASPQMAGTGIGPKEMNTARASMAPGAFRAMPFFIEESIMNPIAFQSCIDACNSCADACDMCAAACLKEPNVTALANCVALDMDCAQICRVGASYMARLSPRARELCRQCAEICHECATECARHQMDHCQKCAEACRSCAVQCQQMAGA